ncbi:hypothetical protein [Micromonospora inositola]|uniref:hypothetical protein n=1 Tax=Micromonospora inositola TaxID=47865 RepID=UPI000B5AD309|nr:hypothetical protein [Micromonospora inositola]
MCLAIAGISIAAVVAVLAFALLLSPVMTRLDAHPAVLRPLAYAVPTTYVADAFRDIFGSGPMYLPFAVDVAVLGGLLVG